MDPMSTTPSEIVEEGVQILRRYLDDPHTADLKQLADLIVRLRSEHHLEDGRTDWGGRSPAYRQSMADLYTRARVPADELDKVQAALRYHVGNLLRERAQGGELEAVGLSPVAPKRRLATARQAIQAQRRQSAPRQDVAKLTAYAQALVEHVDEDAIPGLTPERAVASRMALEAIQARSARLLIRLAEVKDGPAESNGGRHRRRRAVRS